MAEIAARFSEEDLTRYLSLTLEIFKDMQSSLQPRFHLEIGLVRLVQAGRLLPIEEALASLGGESPKPQAPLRASHAATGPAAAPVSNEPRRPSPFELDRAKKAESRPPEPKSSGANALAPQPEPEPEVQTKPQTTPQTGEWRGRLHAALMELGMPFTADAIENARVVENAGELQVFTTKAYSLALRPDDLNKAIRHLGERPLRVRVVIGAAGPDTSAEPVAPLAAAPPPTEDEATVRAFANPEVQRFREVFGGEVRKVRNLKE
jgi:DNA polymerase-3 subunit gamma/tau